MIEREKNSQLYHLHRAVVLPDTAQKIQGQRSYITRTKSLPALFSVTWPDGKPCTLVERYLAERAEELTVRSLDGGSLKVDISNLSPLIRHCWTEGVDFWEIDDAFLEGLKQRLLQERNSRRPTDKRRNRNTVNAILDSIVQFLRWLEKQPFITERIVGVAGEGAQVTLKERWTVLPDGRRIRTLRWKGKVPHDAKAPVHPMDRGTRNRLWDAVASRSEPAKLSRFYTARYSTEDLSHLLKYFRKRRELMLDLCEALGCRPGELARLSKEDNKNCSETNTVLLVTLKQGCDPERRVPVDPGVAIRLENFIHKYRAAHLTYLTRNGVTADEQDCVFLTQNGTPFTEHAMEQDFRTIVEAADLKDVPAMLKMFRHRFITNMVKLHLQAYMSEQAVTRGMFTTADYRTILARVKPFTGHRSEQSLMHYINLAFDELGVFDFVDANLALVNALEESMKRLSELSADLRGSSTRTAARTLSEAADSLISLRDHVHGCLEEQAKAARATRQNVLPPRTAGMETAFPPPR